MFDSIPVDGRRVRELREQMPYRVHTRTGKPRTLPVLVLAQRAGISHTTVQRIEQSSAHRCAPPTVAALAEALGVEQAEIIAAGSSE